MKVLAAQFSIELTLAEEGLELNIEGAAYDDQVAEVVHPLLTKFSEDAKAQLEDIGKREEEAGGAEG